MKNFLKKIFLKEKYNSKTYIQYLKKQGVRIGKNTIIFEPKNVFIDPSRPWLVEIGENVMITRNTTILTHGYDWRVLDGKYGNVLGSSGKVKIGNNVFIGMNSTILKGVTIGDNTIIAAGSLVNKSFGGNVVIGGVPAKVLMSIEDYYTKRLNAQIEEAKQLVLEYYNVYGVIPEKQVLSEFFWLFEKRNKDSLCDKFIEVMNNRPDKEKSWKKFFDTEPYFNSYQDFLDYCFNKV